MLYQRTTAYQKIRSLSKRIRACPGGTSASKTISILMWLIALAQNDKSPTLTSVVAESFPHLRRGALRDFLNILKEHKYFDDNLWDKTNSVYTFETGAQIEFFSVDQPEKVRGARRDRLFINEANNIAFLHDALAGNTVHDFFIDRHAYASGKPAITFERRYNLLGFHEVFCKLISLLCRHPTF